MAEKGATTERGKAARNSISALIAVVWLCVLASGCGGGGRPTSTAASSANAPAERSFKGDVEDDDVPSEVATTGMDNDVDQDNDRKNLEAGYRDLDDGVIVGYGRAASPAEARALTALFRRYYAAAAVSDGATACAMLEPAIARAVPADYGRQSAGPPYLRTATTCPGVMSLLFKHFHGQVTAAITVTGVRIKGQEAYVLLGSRTIPAGYVTLRRGGSGWRVVNLLGETLP